MYQIVMGFQFLWLYLKNDVIVLCLNVNMWEIPLFAII